MTFRAALDAAGRAVFMAPLRHSLRGAAAPAPLLVATAFLCLVAVEVSGELARTAPPVLFQVWGFERSLALFGALVAWAGLVCIDAGETRPFAPLVTLQLLAAAILELLYGPAIGLPGWLLETPPDGLYWGVWGGFVLWQGLVAWRLAAALTSLEAFRTGALAACYVAGMAYLVAQSSFDVFWTTDWEVHESYDATAAEPALDVEEVLHAQHALVEERLAGLAPERAGVADLYLVAFGADATQAVFRREVEFVRELFDRRFDTARRSLALANEEGGTGERPLASRTNLADVLGGVAAKMDLEEDVLFLFLTGHGSQDHEMVVRYPELPLGNVDPTRLREMLDEAGFRWRVLVVSACYSGGFVAPLADDRTLVVTAAASDRRSFGCSNEAELTEFGRAYFAEALEETRSFEEAFASARATLHDREVALERTHSLPQISVGAEVGDKLAELQARLDRSVALAAPAR
ncbi:MAG: hypothetical protein CL910_07735 [Deltaproteobacteria bacterium]|jgi:hypothetical protein|nr:hypothetical protein [Deltaproteobacteria bacterium]